MRKYDRCLFYCYKDFWVNFCSIIIFIIICLILFISFFIKFSFCYRYDGLVSREGDDYYVSIMVDNSWFILQNLPLVVDKKKTSYSIVSISKDYIITNSGLRKQVVLDFDISDEKKISNNILSLYFIHKMTFFQKVKEMLK